MRRLFFVLVSITFAALACNLPVGQSGPEPDAVATSVAATLTAGAPIATTAALATETPAPASTPVPSEAAPPTSTPPGFACSVTYANAGRLYCLKPDGTPMLLADYGSEGIVNSPQISSDGAFVAYLVNLPDNTAELWVVQADGSGARALVSRDEITRGDPNIAESPNTFAWQNGTHTIYFNVRYTILTGEVGPGEYTYNDLWKVDADTGTVLNVLARDSVGRFFLSPNGQYIALSLPQAIDLIRADGSNYHHLLDFPFISTYSEYSLKPAAIWSPDSSFFTVLVPSADPMASDSSGTIYRMGVDGSVQRLATIPGNFVFGGSLQPEISPNGQFVIYSRSAPDGSSAVHLVRTDGTGDAVIDHQQPNGLGWSPDSNHYAYAVIPSGGAGGGFLAPLEGPLQPFASGATILSLQWWDNTSFIFHGLVGTEWGLYYQRLGEPLRTEVGGLNNQSSFDVRAL